MTVTSPTPGNSAPRPSVLRRGFGRAARSVLAVGALLALAAPAVAAPAMAMPAATPAAVGAAASAQPSPTPPPTPDIPLGETVFTLSPVANGTVRPGDELAVSVTLQNGTLASAGPAAVTLSLGSTPLRDRAELTAWLGGQSRGLPLSPIGSTTLEAVPPRSQQVNGIVIAPDDPSLSGRAPGVYPLAAMYDAPDGPILSTSAMIVPRGGTADVGIGVIVPITAGETDAGLLSSLELAALTSSAGSLTDQLDAVEGTGAILGIDPALPAAIRVLGADAPPSATAWLARLESLANSRFALQFGDADIASQLQTGLARPLRPTSLQAYMDPADFAPSTGPSASPDPTPPPDEPALPTVAELTDIGAARDNVYWPATGSATPGVVATLGDLTVDDRNSVTLVPSTSTRAGAAGGTVPGRATAGDADLLVYDADVSRQLHDASVTQESSVRGAPLTAAAAYLAFAAADAGGEPIIVSVDRGAERSRVALRTAISAALQAPGVNSLTLGGVVARIPVPVEITDAAVEQARVDAVAAMTSEEGSLARFATILDDVTLLTGPERAEILQLLGLAWMPDPTAWQDAVTAHRAQTAVTLDSVGILPPSPINLFSAGAPIPIWVRNDLPYPVNVVLYSIPDDLRLDVAQATEAIAGPRSNTRVQVPVQARVGNGDVSVQLQLRSRTLEPIGAPQVVEVNVRADWEGIGIVVMSVLIGGFLVLGVIRTVLRLRTRRAERDRAQESGGRVEEPRTGVDDTPEPAHTDVPYEDAP